MTHSSSLQVWSISWITSSSWLSYNQVQTAMPYVEDVLDGTLLQQLEALVAVESGTPLPRQFKETTISCEHLFGCPGYQVRSSRFT